MTKNDGSQVGRNLGNETDIILNYNLNRFTNIEMGYAMMFASNNMAFAKGQAVTDAVADTYRKTGAWFYAMLKISPDFLFSKTAKVK